MSTAKANAAEQVANTAAAGSASPSARSRQAPAIHALPVNDAATDRHVEPANPGALPVRPGEDPWTEAELAEVIEVLEADIVRFRAQLATSTAELVNLLRDGTEGAGRD